jgi:signal transduction histidine kinase
LLQFEQEETDHNIIDLEGSKIHQGNFLLPAKSSTTTDLIAVVTTLLESVIAIAEEKEITVEVKLPQNPILVQGNSQAIREVLTNLLDNAVKYTPKGGQVKIELLQKEKYQGIKIIDSGCGIPIEDQERIFERNYRGVQQLGKIPGTGLGLAIAKELVEQMQGRIELVSPNELNGTTFVVWFLSN